MSVAGTRIWAGLRKAIREAAATNCRLFPRSGAALSSHVGRSHGSLHRPPRGPSITQARSYFIQTETTPNPDALKFKAGRRILPDNIPSAEFTQYSSTSPSHLARSLFRLNGIVSVFYGPDFVTISKDPDTPWQLLKPDIFSLLAEQFQGEHMLLTGEADADACSTAVKEGDSEVVQMIKEILETRIRSVIQEDGGDLTYLGFENGVVLLKLRGACRTCSLSAETLKGGIENMLKYYVPEVERVEQVVDEAEGISNDVFHRMESKMGELEAPVR